VKYPFRNNQGIWGKWSKIILVAVVALLVFLATGPFREKPGIIPGISILTEVNGFFESILSYPAQWFSSLVHPSIYGKGTPEVLTLRHRIIALEKELAHYREVEIENIELRHMLNLKRHTRLNILIAKVIAEDGIPWIKSMILNKGSSDGVTEMDPVLVGRDNSEDGGLVAGEVVNVTLHTSRLLLITDYDCRIAAIDQRSRVRGILVGQGHGICSLKFVQNGKDIKVGDVIVTSGLDGVFPKGFLLGKVVSISPSATHGLFQRVIVKPFVELNYINWVGVVLKTKSID